MKILFRPYCWFLSFMSWVLGGEPYVSGHSYVEIFEDSKKSVLVCERCGERSVGFYD